MNNHQNTDKERIKFTARINRRRPQMFPVNNQPFDNGECAILVFDVYETLEGEIQLNSYGNISVKGWNFPSDYDFDTLYTIVAELDKIDPKYGKQWVSLMCTTSIDLTDVWQQKIFLQSFLNDKQIQSLYEVLDDPIKDMEKGDKEALKKAKGIGNYIADLILEKFELNKDYTEAYVNLSSYGMTPALIKKLCDQYKSPHVLVQKIEKNPYMLVGQVKGIGFKTVDEMALTNGMPRMSNTRLEAYIRHILEEGAQQGFSWISSTVLVNKIENELDIFPIESIVEVVTEMKTDKIVWDGELGVIALQRYYQMEVDIKNESVRIRDAEGSFDFEGWEDRIKQAELLNGFPYTDEQKEAIKVVIENQVSVISGGAGCVDCDTEYFNGVEWVRIAEYKEGDRVLQYDPINFCSSLANPIEVIKRPEHTFYHFTGANIDQKLTGNHAIAIFDESTETIGWMHVDDFLLVKDNGHYVLGRCSISFLEVATIFVKTKKKQSTPLDYKVERVESEDGFTYCFRVPTSYLVLRRNGRNFVTHNCGKTTTVLGALKALGDVSFTQCALSGRASARMEEATGYSAATIHRTLGFNPMGGDNTFAYNKENPLSAQVVILDEVSMVGGLLLLNLLQAIPSGSKFIMIGDVDQLPSIGVLNVANDVIESPYIKVGWVTQIHRQAAKSGVIVDAHKVKNSIQITEKDFVGKEVRGELQDFEIDIYNDTNLTVGKTVQHFKEKLAICKDIMEVQIIAPMRTRGESSVYNLNLLAQEVYNPSNPSKAEVYVSIDKDKGYALRVGDKVINVKNNYKMPVAFKEDNRGYHTKSEDGKVIDTEVFNGYIGTILDIVGTDVVVEIPLTEDVIMVPMSHWRTAKAIELAYAITAHKIQGDSCDYPICVIDSSHYRMLSKEWLYTAMTRSSKYCTLVAENRALHQAISTTAVRDKQTFLVGLLEEEYQEQQIKLAEKEEGE